jgi:hypothetical protein
MVKTYRRRSIQRGGWFWDSSGNTSSGNTLSWNPSSWSLSSLNPFSSSSTPTTTPTPTYSVEQTPMQSPYSGLPTYPVAQSTGGRRRRRVNKMSGGDFMANSPLSGFASDAMEVHDIKMAQPQTLVGGRRRRRKGSKRRGRTARKSKRSRRN